MRDFRSQKPVVLVIDDEHATRQFLRTLLELDGYWVYEAKNGPMGLSLIPAVTPTVVLLDFMMPGMDGVEVCRRIVADYPELPVVVLTARDDVEVEMTCREAGAAAFMTKPLLSGQLTDVLTSVLRA